MIFVFNIYQNISKYKYHKLNGGMENNNKVIYKDLSYKIVGVLFEVYNNLGAGLQEKYYERAVAESFKKKNILYKRQVPFKIVYKGKNIGRYFLDFIVEDKIILELKRGEHFSRKYIEQIKGYLAVTNMKLAILAHFTSRGVKIFRAFNPNNLK